MLLLGLSVGVAVNPKGVQVDEYLHAGERLWAIGDVNGIWPLTHVGEYEGDVVAANIAGELHPANYEAVPRVTYTDPQAASVGSMEADYSATSAVSEVPKTATYTHAYVQSKGFLTLLSDGERLTGAYALWPEAGEWMQQATLAIPAQSRRTSHSPYSPTRSNPFPVSRESTTRAWKSSRWSLRTCRGQLDRWPPRCRVFRVTARTPESKYRPTISN